MASLQEKIRVNRAYGTRNTMTDYGNSSLYDMDEYEEQRDRLTARVASIRRRFEACCQCGHTDAAMDNAEDLAYWSNKLARLNIGKVGRLG